MYSAILLSVLLSAPPDASPLGSLSEEHQSPYQVAVCLRMADDPLLTPQFAAGLRRQVRDQLRNFFGPLAAVTVYTAGHWLVDDYAHDDVELPFLDAEIIQNRGLAGQAFVCRISYERQQYHIRWRVIDGETGRAGAIREQRTPDRQWVAKTVCLAARSGFVVRANIKPGTKDGTADVTFIGEEHQSYLQRVLGDRCFMQLYWVARRRSGVARTEVPNTLLLWSRKNGRHSATVVSTYGNPWGRRAGLAYVGVRLQTQPGRLRLRLVDQERSTPVVSVQVSANDRGFEAIADRDILPRARRDGVVVSPTILQHVAYVRVHAGGGSVIHVPLPITADISDHVLSIPTGKNTLAKNDYARDLRFLNQDLQTLQAIISAANQTTNAFNSRKRYEDALTSVQEAVEAVGPSLRASQTTLTDLKQQADELQVEDRRPLEMAAARLEELTTRGRELTEIQTTLGEAIESRDAGKRASVIAKLGEQAERDADFEEAITRYELALAEYADQPKLAAHLEELKSEWSIKSPKHKSAREAIYARWPEAEVTEIGGLLAEIQEAFETLKNAGDSLTARKLLLVNTEHTVALSDLVQQLAARSDEADRADTDKYKRLSEQLAAFTEAVGKYVTDRLADAPSPPENGQPPPAANRDDAPQGKEASKGGSSLLDLDDEEEEGA